MSQVKWIKIVVDIFDDEKIKLIESLPDGYKITTAWFKLLCLAGKCCFSGVLMMNDRVHYTEEMLSTIFRMPLSTVRLALKTFEQFEMIDIIDETITIPNWGKHQSIDKLEAKTKYMKDYMKEYRKKQEDIVSTKQLEGGKSNGKSNGKVNVSPTELDTELDTERNNKEQEKVARFDEFYKLYPKKQSKEQARKSWMKLDMTEELFDTIMSKLRMFIDSEQWQKDNGKFVPMPSTWINNRRWEDEIMGNSKIEPTFEFDIPRSMRNES